MNKTTDYSIFGEIESNREVDLRHVRKLMKAIEKRNLLHLNPIIVDEQNRVIEGQHRLEAAKQLQVPIYYITDNTVNKSDIAALNTNKKNWSAQDYINFHCIEKRPGFSVLSKFLSEHPAIPTSSAIQLLSPFSRRNMEEIREGYADVSNLAMAEKIAAFLKWLRNHFEHAYSGMVIQAVRKLFESEGFDPEHLKRKIEDQPRSVVKCIKTGHYVEMFLDIYNYKLSTNRLTIKAS